MSKSNKYFNLLLLILFCLSFCFIIYRAFFISIVHDEALSFTILTGDSERILDANNHWLNTYLSMFLSKIFGFNKFLLRLPNVLAFVLFFYYITKIFLTDSKNKNLLLLVLALSFSNMFYLEFFSLFRGYGLAIAFLTAACYYFLELNNSYSAKKLMLAILFSILTIYANYSFLICILSLQLIYIAILFIRIKKTNKKDIITQIALFLVELLCLLPAVFNLFNLKKQGKLYVGGNVGFFHDTFKSVLDYTFPDYLVNNYIKIIYISLLIPFLLVIVFRKINKQFIFISTFIFLNIFIPIGFHYFFKVNFSTERAAVYWTLLLGLYFYAVINSFEYNLKNVSSYIVIVALFAILSFSFQNFVLKLNVTKTTTWNYDENTEQFMIDLEKHNAAKNKVTLGINWLFEPSINFYRVVYNYDWLVPVTRDNFADKNYDLYYITNGDKSNLKTNCKEIQNYKSTDCIFLENSKK